MEEKKKSTMRWILEWGGQKKDELCMECCTWNRQCDV